MTIFQNGTDAIDGNTKNPESPTGFGKIVMWTVLFQIAWSWRSLSNIVSQGALPGPDDFMRLIQIRGLMAGQAWFDTTAYRMLPPQGADIHWSRLIDAPIAGLIYLLTPIFGTNLAERVTTMLWPTLLLVATVLIITKICDSLFTNYNRLLPVFFTVLCVSSLAQFVPGRIDHHNFQILLYAGLLWCVVNWKQPIANIIAGFTIPLSISIGLDVLIFAVWFMVWFGCEWVFGSDQNGKALKRFALSMAASGLILFPVNIPQSQWLVAHCDANSIVYLTAVLLISTSMFFMSSATPIISHENAKARIIQRFTAAGVLAVMSALALAFMFPSCLGGPFVALSDELNTRWLSQVSEAKTLFTVLADQPEYWLKTIAYCVLIFITGVLILRQNIDNKKLIAIIFATFLIGLAMSVFQYRTIRISFFAAIPISVLATELLARKLKQRFGDGSLKVVSGQIAAIIFLSTASWTLIGGFFVAKPNQAHAVTTSQETNIVSADLKRKTCFHESDYQLLTSLPKGRVISGLNSAAPILVFTDKSVVAGPYHRNQQGILDVLDFYYTNEDKAKKVVETHRVDYVVYCKTSRPKKRKQKSVVSMQKQFMIGQQFDWLEQLSKDEDKLLVLRVIN